MHLLAMQAKFALACCALQTILAVNANSIATNSRAYNKPTTRERVSSTSRQSSSDSPNAKPKTFGALQFLLLLLCLFSFLHSLFVCLFVENKYCIRNSSTFFGFVLCCARKVRLVGSKTNQNKNKANKLRNANTQIKQRKFTA